MTRRQSILVQQAAWGLGNDAKRHSERDDRVVRASVPELGADSEQRMGARDVPGRNEAGFAGKSISMLLSKLHVLRHSPSIDPMPFGIGSHNMYQAEQDRILHSRPATTPRTQCQSV